ncbi:amidohydrolase family protein [Ferrovibrio sp. MS7]|uniref:amidohydrolase family protein n=1 Tax=Ferrovibrio plantarum TaxID=3119164 RepID=UPI0031362598
MAGKRDDRREWFAQVQETAIDPDRPIIDPHFHFFTGRGHEFLAADFLTMVDTGHNIRGAIHMEANADFFIQGGAPGEMRFATEQGARMRELQQGRPRICDPVAGVIGYTDLRSTNLDAEIDALIEASGGRLCGIRNSAAWHPDPGLLNGHTNPPEGLLADSAFRRGLKRLAERGLAFDTYVYFPRLSEIADLARAVPEAAIVCNHMGGVIGVGPYKGRHAEYFEEWKSNIALVAQCPNLCIKLGGMAMSPVGFGWHKRDRPLDSMEYATHYEAWFDHVITQFGPSRCMFESNFPVDGVAIAYPVLWNGFKRLTIAYSETEKNALFHDTAKRVYRLPL